MTVKTRAPKIAATKVPATRTKVYRPMPYEDARDMEVALGIALREAGYGAWQA